MILQRCQDQTCRNYFSTSEHVCPRCKRPIPRGYKYLACRKQIDGKRYYKILGFKSMLEAQEEYKRWERELEAPPAKPVDEITLQQVSQAYLQKLEADGSGYVKNSKLFLDRLIEFAGRHGVTRALDLTDGLLRQFQSGLRQGKASPAYCDRHLAIIKASWNHTFGRSVPNPVSAVKFFHPDNVLIRFLTTAEETRVLQAAEANRDHIQRYGGSKHFFEILLIAIHTGMREKNILDLHTNETDFDSGTITVRQKRDLSHTVVMNSLVHNTLWRIRPAEGGYYFANPETGKPYGRITGAWAFVKREAGITRPFRFHDLRHHFGTKLGEKTGNPRLIMSALGHRSMTTSLRYVHQDRELLRGVLEDMVAATPEAAPGPKSIKRTNGNNT